MKPWAQKIYGIKRQVEEVGLKGGGRIKEVAVNLRVSIRLTNGRKKFGSSPGVSAFLCEPTFLLRVS